MMKKSEAFLFISPFEDLTARRKNRRMKILSPILLACALAAPSFAEDAKTNSTSEKSSSAKGKQPVVTLSVSTAEVTAPLVLTNGCISQPEKTELPAGGKAVYNFTITNAGNYLIKAMVNAPEEDSNSLYVNIDAQPEDPAMIWDIVDVTSGFEERTVSWRGKGTPEQDEIVPKHFKLSAGAHKLIVVGREPAQWKSISILPAAD